jgi:ribosomal-protein-serine acetyltransferase
MRNIKLDRKKIELNDGKVVLRPHRLSDIDAMYQAVRESLAELSPWLPFAHQDYAIKESRAWIKQRPKEWQKGISYGFAIFDAKDSSYLGGCGINRIDDDNLIANLGYWIRTSRTGHGAAPAAARLLAAWGLKELGLKRIEIVVATENKRSLRAAEKAGTIREGILRNRILVRDKTYDAVMFSLIPPDFNSK